MCVLFFVFVFDFFCVFFLRQDDPLLAEALAASLRGEDGSAETASDSRSLMERFPALRAQVLSLLALLVQQYKY